MRSDIVKGIIVGAICTSAIFTSMTVFGKVSKETITVSYDNIKLVVDGKTVTPKDGNGNVVEPFTYNGTTYLPLRAAVDAITGGTKPVSWDGNTSTIYIGSAQNNQNNNNSQSNKDDSYISREKAESIALEKTNGGTVKEYSFGRDDGRAQHEFDIINENYKYDVDVDAVSGAIVEFKSELLKNNSTNSSYIGIEKAKSIALSESGGGTVVKAEFDGDDDDDDVAEYEIKIINGDYEYDIKINAITGSITEKEVESKYDD